MKKNFDQAEDLEERVNLIDGISNVRHKSQDKHLQLFDKKLIRTFDKINEIIKLSKCLT